MSSNILFSETQKFNQWWIKLILLPINALFIYGFYQQIVLKQPFGDKPMSDIGIIIFTILVLLFTLLFLNLKLVTTIKINGIDLQFYPFHLKAKHYNWADIIQWEVRTYDAISEFGGWGIRIGGFKKGMAYNVSGNKGLQLVLKTNKKLLIGTNKAEQLTETLRNLAQLKLKEFNGQTL